MWPDGLFEGVMYGSLSGVLSLLESLLIVSFEDRLC